MNATSTLFAIFARSAIFLLILGAVSPSVAQPNLGGPGSVLIYPVFDARPGIRTCISVTNTNQSYVRCGHGFREGDICLFYYYFSATTCTVFDRTEELSPGDTVTVVVDQHNPNFVNGFLVIQATDPATQLPIDFDFLTGSATIASATAQGALDNGKWTYLAYAFEGIAANPNGSDDCGRKIVTMTSNFNFDGTDYTTFPDEVILEHFEGEGTPLTQPGNYKGTLYLMNSSRLTANVSMAAWNNNSVPVTRNFSTSPCLEEYQLTDLSPALTQVNLAVGYNPSELRGISTGWLRLNSTSPQAGLLGVYRERLAAGAARYIAGRALSIRGSRAVTLTLGP